MGQALFFQLPLHQLGAIVPPVLPPKRTNITETRNTPIPFGLVAPETTIPTSELNPRLHTSGLVCVFLGVLIWS